MDTGADSVPAAMKNADGMLKEIIKVVDTNGDGKVQYEEFRVFVEAAERQLLVLFNTIDRDQNGKLDKDELQTAFQRAGIAIPVRRLNDFFEDIDHNKDGFITYEEWRDFLLFMPNADPATTLRSVISFYSEILTLTAEGDSIVSDETLEGLDSPTNPPNSTLEENQERKGPTKQASPLSNAAAKMDIVATRPYVNATEDDMISKADTSAVSQGIEPPMLPTTRGAKAEPGLHEKGKKFVLISYLPDPGYFIAGAVAGGISRTATAPLDRLKVYLLVNTSADASLVVKAAKKGQPLLAVRNAGRPLITAVTDLYKAGGFRGFFAGNGLNVVKIMPETAIRFGAYEAAKRTLADLEGHGDTHHINPYSKFVAGGFAGMVSQLQSEYVSGGARGNALLIQTFRKMYAEGGARAAYRGVTMGLIGMFPYSAIDMGTFEFLKATYVGYMAKKYGVHEEDAQPNTFATGIMGATSGAFGASVVYPLNVLRTRLQTQGTSMHPARYTGIWDVANKTVRNEGVRGLYKGLMPNLLKVAPALSITWMVYENAKHIMNLH
ncbi:hypothetical protein DL764_010950 [Monosporascus ibericus]|uniref:Mitochondrial thiamine pyrophosphate carrier 1 n=1 Tax=Monosporascus ibericus TaxID=155417 RepID=A0A4Q4ST47_9PEZI|nr:hypothetical protein DL764_010950 [Monosporascus ibericus]